MKIALFPGRFQPFHLGHLHTIKKVLKINDRVIIAVRDTSINDRNPFSFQERVRIISQSIKEDTLDSKRCKIIRIPDICDQWVKRIGTLIHFDAIYTGNHLVGDPFKNSNYPVVHMSRAGQGGEYSGSKIRDCLSRNKSISAYTHPLTATLIYKIYKNRVQHTLHVLSSSLQTTSLSHSH